MLHRRCCGTHIIVEMSNGRSRRGISGGGGGGGRRRTPIRRSRLEINACNFWSENKSHSST